MLTAIFGDGHACCERDRDKNRNKDEYEGLALEQVITSARKNGAERFVFLGDVIGYGPNPIDCINLMKRVFVRKTKDGIYTQIPNRHMLLGNHGLMFLKGEIPKYIDDDAEASIERIWEQLGVDISKDPVRPAIPGKADEILKSIHKGIKLPQRSLRRRFSDLWHGRKDYMSPEDLTEIEKSMDPETREKFQRARELKIKEDKFKPYHDFFSSLPCELDLGKEGGQEKLMFAHAFPLSMAKYADQLGIDKNAIGFLEVYIIKREDWISYVKDPKNYYELDDTAIENLEAYVKGQTKNLGDLGLTEEKKQEVLDLRRRTAIAEDVVKFMPEGYTLFIGHNHDDFIVDGKEGRRIISPGAVFNPRAEPGDEDYEYAHYVLYESSVPQDVICGRVKYNRDKVNRYMEEAKHGN
ncbi:hypothetical protein KY343_03410 [Candidatus Woesearchaeota archaeon]|nr:hypothetical protein [Candidatus Woesearchaeota archaeon]